MTISTDVARTPQVGMRVVVPATATDGHDPVTDYITAPATGTVVAPAAHRLSWLWDGEEGLVFVDVDGDPDYSGDQPLVVRAADLALEA